jgi:hypothetical protein
MVARRSLLPAVLYISQRLTDGWNVDHNNVFQAAALIIFIYVKAISRAQIAAVSEDRIPQAPKFCGS